MEISILAKNFVRIRPQAVQTPSVPWERGGGWAWRRGCGASRGSESLEILLGQAFE